MKFIYNLLQNIAEKLCAPSLVTSFNWGGSYTPAYSGIMLMRVQRTTSAGAVVFYVKDTTAAEFGIGAISTGTIPANHQNSICFPVIKGHKYETEYTEGVANVTCRFYKVPSWGGTA